MPDKTEDEKKPPVAAKEKKNGHNGNGVDGSAEGGTSRLGRELGDVPSIPPPPVSGPWRSYKEVVSQLASRIVEAQRPIRVLNAIRWDDTVEDQLRKSKFKEMPKVDYDAIDLGFEPRAKAEEFEAIARDIDRELGEGDAIGRIMEATALEYRDCVQMLASRGTPAFYAFSRKLYGSPKDTFPDGKSTVRDLGHLLYEILTNVDDNMLGQQFERTINAEQAVVILNDRFADYFADTDVRVSADDDIVADAAAGNDYVKIRNGAMFSPRDIDILEVHEGWVHVATSLNGQRQTVAKWLSKGPPRTTAVQEGLAALLELFTFRTYPRRARRLNDRLLAVDKAEDGASFLDVFEWFRTEGYEEDDCFHAARRVFRGGVLEGGAPFTKDASYRKGIV
ncbi:MAG TPA: flavohemoglobin expression-modulating QEGLA motif protein, partial [Polyangiaceae bacterium]